MKKYALPLLLCICGIRLSSAQSFSTTATSLGQLESPRIKPSSPANLYGEDTIARVDLFTGKLQVHIPIGTIGGRGDVSIPLVTLDHPQWDFETTTYCTIDDGSWYCNQSAAAYFGRITSLLANDTMGQSKVVATVAFHAGTFCSVFTGWGGTRTWFSAGKFLTRLYYMAPDGTHTELVDAATYGKPQDATGHVDGGCGIDGIQQNEYLNRGREFVATDGSGLHFMANQDISDGHLMDPFTGPQIGNYGPLSEYPVDGVLAFSDGRTLQLNGDDRKWKDRNGNVTHNFTDSLQRTTSITDNTTITVPGTYGGTQQYGLQYGSFRQALRSGYTSKSVAELFSDWGFNDGDAEWEAHFVNPSVLTRVNLPNGTFYSLQYNEYGEIAKLTYPTGGYREFDWVDHFLQMSPDNEMWEGDGMTPSAAYQLPSRVGEERDYDSTGALLQVIVYPHTDPTSWTDPLNATFSPQVLHYSDAGKTQLVKSETHTFAGSPWYEPGVYQAPWKLGKEVASQIGSIRSVSDVWDQRPCGSECWFGNPLDTTSPAHAPRLIQRQVVTDGASVTSAFCYDGYSNLTDKYTFPIGVAPQGDCEQMGGYLRREHMDYVTSPTYTASSVNLLRLPLSTNVFAADGSKESQTDFGYDETPPTSTDAVTGQTLPAATGWEDPATTAHGNRTSISRWINTSGGSLRVTFGYDSVGNVVTQTDTKGNVQKASYLDSFVSGSAQGNTQAYMTRSQNAIGQTASAIYDFNTGNMTSLTDANGKEMSLSYEASPAGAGRLIQAVDGSNTSKAAGTYYEYSDEPGSVQVRTFADLSALGDKTRRSRTNFDGFGRKVRTETDISQNQTIFQTWGYDSLGRVSSTSNQLFHLPSQGDPSMSFEYDILDRPLKTINPDQTWKSWEYGAASGLRWDENGNGSINTYDALGRLVAVGDSLSGGPNGNRSPATVTNYTFDARDNITGVIQGQGAGRRERHFVYDSLSRLTSSLNPETGTVSYQYVNDQNVPCAGDATLPCRRTDARGVATSYSYDAINRLTQTIHSDGTPTECWAFDATLHGIGKLSQQWTQTSNCGSAPSATALTSKTVTQYDEVGRVSQVKQCVLASCTGDGDLAFEYDLAGGQTTYTVPTSRDRMAISIGHNAAGWPVSFTSGVVGSQNATPSLLTIESFFPDGALHEGTLAANLSITKDRDARLRPVSEAIRVK